MLTRLALLAVAIAACSHSHPTTVGNVAASTEPDTRATYPLMCEDNTGCGTGDLRIDVRDDGTLATTIQISDGGESRCKFDGTLVPQGDPMFPAWTYDADEPDGYCHILLTLGKDRYVLSSEGCHWYCGAHADLFGEFGIPGAGT